MSETVNPILTKVEDIVKVIAWDSLVTATLIELNINIWPVNSFIILFTNKLFSILKMNIDMAAIPIINADHKRDLERSIATLQIIALNKGIDSPEFHNAKENAKAAFSKFVRVNA